MATVTLPQGRYIGTSNDNISIFHGIPYAQPLKRFQLPQPLTTSDKEFQVTEFSYNCPQNQSRLNTYLFKANPPAKYDETHAPVLSIYTPQLPSNSQSTRLPVIIWIHGGAFITGGSQLSGYDGTLLAQDANAVVVAINYRLGPFGFLYDPKRSLDNDQELPCGTADVVIAFEWVQANIASFGGDPENITSFGQSAGAYHTQTLLDIRPDLLDRAILQSSPADLTTPPKLGEKVREEVIETLPESVTLVTATVEQLNAAATAVMRKFGADTLAPFGPTTTKIPGFIVDKKDQQQQKKKKKKQILVGWTKTDGMVFDQIRAPPGTPVSELPDSTDVIFRNPSKIVAEKFKADGHEVTTFEMNWAPNHVELGPTHCSDLPLVFGAELWASSAYVKSESMEEWELRGKKWRAAIGRFVKDGTGIQSMDGIEVFSCIFMPEYVGSKRANIDYRRRCATK